MLPPNLLDDFFEDEEFRRIFEAITLEAALVDQTHDRQIKRAHQEGLAYMNITPTDPLLALLKTIQTEILNMREDFNLIANAVKSIHETNQVILAKQKTLHQEIYGNKKRPKKNQ